MRSPEHNKAQPATRNIHTINSASPASRAPRASIRAASPHGITWRRSKADAGALGGIVREVRVLKPRAPATRRTRRGSKSQRTGRFHRARRRIVNSLHARRELRRRRVHPCREPARHRAAPREGWRGRGRALRTRGSVSEWRVIRPQDPSR